MSGEANKQAKAGNPGATPPTAGTRRKKSRLLLILGLLILSGGAAAWFVMNRTHADEASKAAANPAAPKYIVHLEGFTVNLADPEETHFLRLTIDLGIDHLPDGVDKEKAASALPVPRIRDAILSVLTACKADVLLTAEGKIQLKKNLIDALSRSVPELGVREVYFSEFLVQR